MANPVPRVTKSNQRVMARAARVQARNPPDRISRSIQALRLDPKTSVKTSEMLRKWDLRRKQKAAKAAAKATNKAAKAAAKATNKAATSKVKGGKKMRGKKPSRATAARSSGRGSSTTPS